MLFKNQIDKYFFNIENINYLAISYLFLSIVLFLTRNNTLNQYDKISYKYAFIIGLAHGLDVACNSGAVSGMLVVVLFFFFIVFFYFFLLK